MKIVNKIINIVEIAISIAKMQQQPQSEPEQLTCTLGNIVTAEGATVNITCNINCTVAQQ